MLGAYVLHPVVFQLGVESLLNRVGLANQYGARVGVGFAITLLLVAALRCTSTASDPLAQQRGGPGQVRPTVASMAQGAELRSR